MSQMANFHYSVGTVESMLAQYNDYWHPRPDVVLADTDDDKDEDELLRLVKAYVESLERGILVRHALFRPSAGQKIVWRVPQVLVKSESYGYRLYWRGHLVYIGITNSPVDRAMQHAREKVFDKMTVEFFGSDAAEWEVSQIANFRPVLNKLLYRRGTGEVFYSSEDELSVKNFKIWHPELFGLDNNGH